MEISLLGVALIRRDLSDLVLEFALHHQGMGTRRSAAAGTLVAEAKGAGINLVFWPIETLYRINLRHRNA